MDQAKTAFTNNQVRDHEAMDIDSTALIIEGEIQGAIRPQPPHFGDNLSQSELID